MNFWSPNHNSLRFAAINILHLISDLSEPLRLAMVVIRNMFGRHLLRILDLDVDYISCRTTTLFLLFLLLSQFDYLLICINLTLLLGDLLHILYWITIILLRNRARGTFTTGSLFFFGSLLKSFFFIENIRWNFHESFDKQVWSFDIITRKNGANPFKFGTDLHMNIVVILTLRSGIDD